MSDPNDFASYEDYLKSTIDPSLLRGSGKFEAKLSFHERCQVLALDKFGVHRYVIAEVMGISRPTVGYITRPNSPHYKPVRQRFEEVGRDAFLREYLDKDLMERVEKAKKLSLVKATDAQIGEIRKAKSAELEQSKSEMKGPDENANQFAGQKYFYSEATQKTDLFTVVWLTADEINEAVVTHDMDGTFGDGWYILDKSGRPYPDDRKATTTKAFNTSQQAMNYLRQGYANSGYEEMEL